MYRTPPSTPRPAPKAPAHRLLWAEIRGVMLNLQARQERLRLRQFYPRASWDAVNDVAIDRARVTLGSSDMYDALDAADNRIMLDYEDGPGFYRPGRVDFRARVSRAEHQAWKHERQ